MTKEWQGLGTRLGQLQKHSEEAKVRGRGHMEEGHVDRIRWQFN